MNKKTAFFILFYYVLIILIFTFPLFLNSAGFIPGTYHTDEPFAYLWDSWRINYAFTHHTSLTHTDLIRYPYGAELYNFQIVPLIGFGWQYLLQVFTPPALSSNIQVSLNILLMAFLGFLLVYYLTKNRSAGFLSGIIFGFCPYQFVRIWQHISLTYNECIILPILGIILLKDNLSKRNIVIFALSLLLALSFDFSIMYMSFMGLISYFVYIIIHWWREKLSGKTPCMQTKVFLKKSFIIIFFVFFLLSPQFFPIIKNMLKLSPTKPASAHNLYHRPFEDLFSQSAKPLGYLLPSAFHPVFGKFTENFIGSPLYGESFTEHTLYLGWIPLGLAFVAVRRWRKNRKKTSTVDSQQSTERENYYIGLFMFLAVAAWIFSQPPWWKIGPIKIYMPSFFMYKVLPMYRAYCRFGIVVMLAVSVLAGFGLKFILERFKTRKTRITIATLFCGLVLFEFWNWPPYKVIDVSKAPAVYSWLKNQPEDLVIAEYPLDADTPNEMYKFYQTKHEKKIINGTIPGTYANKVAQTIVNLAEIETASRLKWMGVKYVLVHNQEYLNTGLSEKQEELTQIPKNKGLKLVKTFPPQDCPDKNIMCVQKTGPIDVYEVVASPVEPKIKD